MSLTVHALNGGSCRHLLATIDGRSLRIVRFHAVFLAIHHPDRGWIMVDTGYGDRFFAATRKWPFRLYRWATPVTLRGPAAAAIRPLGIRPEQVRHMVVTHFHADHVGGLAEFSHARVHFVAEALDHLASLSPRRQVRSAFLPCLIPPDLDRRSEPIPLAAFAPSGGLPFPVHDLFGDGSIRLVHLPGHAPGQVGLELDLNGVRTLYCADAYWHAMQIHRAIDLPRWVRRFQWDPAAYDTTIARLRLVAGSGSHRLFACHDAEIQRHVLPEH